MSDFDERAGPIGRSLVLVAVERTRADPRATNALLGDDMKPTAQLHQLGQSLWLDNITREMLPTPQLQRYIDVSSVSGLNRADRSAEPWDAT